MVSPVVSLKSRARWLSRAKPQSAAISVMVWLVEARELAIDAESSNKKHDTFNKYKGRINNYLSARGYNIQKER